MKSKQNTNFENLTMALQIDTQGCMFGGRTIRQWNASGGFAYLFFTWTLIEKLNKIENHKK